MSDIKDINLAPSGKAKIEWVKSYMPVLNLIEQEFIKEQPFKGKKIAMSIHLEAKTAYLAQVLKAGGALVYATGCNPLSTQDDVAAALVKYWEIPVLGYAGESVETYRKHVEEAINFNPDIIIDDGCDIVATLHANKPEVAKSIIGSTEETTTGIIRSLAISLRLRVMSDTSCTRFSVFLADCIS